MKFNAEFKEEYLENWPHRWYTLSPQERRSALLEQCRRSPDNTDDIRRRAVFDQRFDASFNDLFLQAWMMLKTADVQAPGFFLKKKYERDVRREFARLGLNGETPDEILKEEWKQFADMMIRMYLTSPSYRSAVFGMGAVNDRNTALRLASEIEAVTKTVPERASLGKLVLPFRTVLLERFTALIPDGEAILAEVQSR